MERRGTPLSEANGFNRPILILKKEYKQDVAAIVSAKYSEDSDNDEKKLENEKKKAKKAKKKKTKKRDRGVDEDGYVVGSSNDEGVVQNDIAISKRTKVDRCDDD